MTSSRERPQYTGRVLIAALAALFFHLDSALAQAPTTSEPHKATLLGFVSRGSGIDPNIQGLQVTELVIQIDFGQKMKRTQITDLVRFLEDRNHYSFVSDWPGADNLVEFSGENPPFTLRPAIEGEPPAIWVEPTDRFERAKKPEDQEDRFWRLILRGQAPANARGEIRVAQPPASDGWKIATTTGTTTSSNEAVVRYSFVRTKGETGFRGKAQVGAGTGGPTLDISASWLPNTPSGEVRESTMTFGFAAKLPLGLPSDVKDTPGAERDASEKAPDMMSADFNFISYGQGGNLIRAGARARATGTGKGAELVGYYNPFTGWFSESRGFYGLEGESGYRKGDAEFKDLTTKAPDRGHLVVRIGGVAEWAPQLGGINRDLSRGLRFFIRGRGWLDMYDNDSGNRSVRFAPFVDSELFYNFTSEARVFLRAEYGSLPPDLTEKIKRVYAGVGAAF